MTRQLLAFFAPALLAAQTQIPFPGDDRLKIRRPKNGQCPICLTMAEPYSIAIGPYSWQQDPSRRIDCDYCGCTFRQWAEGKEPKR